MQHYGGFIHDPSLVFRLKKSLYGLKQSLRTWYAKIDNFLLSLGFERCKYDPNVYLNNLDDSLTIIVLYVDDILIIGSFIGDIGSINSSLHNVFSMNDLGLLKQFLGLEIEKFDTCTKFIQSKYASDLLFKFNMDEFNETKFRFLSGVKLGEFSSFALVDNLLYM